ncbi:MAG: DUF2779 domain-containing protein [Nitrospirae bacterium]|nr:DUF2779 domain-containing protein [Nitrospirota bacterium]
MRNVSKEIFLNALVCPTLGWLIRMSREEVSREPTLGERFRMEQGMEIGKKARELYNDGVLIVDRNIASASKETKSLIDNPNISVLFEGTFLIDGFIAKADILKRKGDDWHMIEVKSSVNDKEEFIDDMAYTTMVIGQCGFDISTVSLRLISKDFRLEMKNENLFVEIDHTDEVLDRIEVFKPFCEPIEKITRQSVKPEPKLRFECRKCELFKECLGKEIDNHIFDIPRLSQSKFDKLMELDIVCMEDIPDGFSLTENQARVRDCVQTKKPFVGDRLEGDLESISWPAHYLDFETVMTAIPLYPDIAPYIQIPTQYSIHKCSEPGHIIDHFEYLADPSKDCRRELAENLINDLKGKGSIIIYGNFEKTIITSIGRVYPGLSIELNSLIDRMMDLEAVIRKNFYHPDFHGSTSIKRTLPTIVPDMSYNDLEIADGDSAMAAFAYLALGKYEDREAETIKRNLLDYCKQDTLAMVKLHRQLVEYI